ncbi:hypothetical protein BDW22DRAFT_1140624 [Trametopsis cervina]|nr:hypothetical protein BDW22DRAFT_1140624 [Trametopsis cervina]
MTRTAWASFCGGKAGETARSESPVLRRKGQARRSKQQQHPSKQNNRSLGVGISAPSGNYSGFPHGAVYSSTRDLRSRRWMDGMAGMAPCISLFRVAPSCRTPPIDGSHRFPECGRLASHQTQTRNQAHGKTPTPPRGCGSRPPTTHPRACACRLSPCHSVTHARPPSRAVCLRRSAPCAAASCAPSHSLTTCDCPPRFFFAHCHAAPALQLQRCTVLHASAARASQSVSQSVVADPGATQRSLRGVESSQSSPAARYLCASCAMGALPSAARGDGGGRRPERALRTPASSALTTCDERRGEAIHRSRPPGRDASGDDGWQNQSRDQVRITRPIQFICCCSCCSCSRSFFFSFARRSKRTLAGGVVVWAVEQLLNGKGRRWPHAHATGSSHLPRLSASGRIHPSRLARSRPLALISGLKRSQHQSIRPIQLCGHRVPLPSPLQSHPAARFPCDVPLSRSYPRSGVARGESVCSFPVHRVTSPTSAPASPIAQSLSSSLHGPVYCTHARARQQDTPNLLRSKCGGRGDKITPIC